MPLGRRSHAPPGNAPPGAAAPGHRHVRRTPAPRLIARLVHAADQLGYIGQLAVTLDHARAAYFSPSML